MSGDDFLEAGAAKIFTDGKLRPSGARTLAKAQPSDGERIERAYLERGRIVNVQGDAAAFCAT